MMARRKGLEHALISLAFAAITAYAVISGLAWKHDVATEQANPPREHAETRSQWFTSLRRAESGESVSPALARPMNLPVLVQRPAGPLAQLAHRNEELYPSTATINGFTNEALIFRRYEIEGPSTLMHGQLDMVFVVVVLLPLILCLLNYNNLSTDRELGRLDVLITHGWRPSRLLWTRTIQHSLAPLAVIVVASVTGAILDDPTSPGVWVRLLGWLGIVSLYWTFWVALCAWMATWSKNPLNAALAAVSLWVGIVVLLPSLLQVVTVRITDPPSKIHVMSLARTAQAEALQSVDERVEAFMAEHGSEIPSEVENVAAYYRRAYVSNSAINSKVGSLLDEYNAQLDDDLKLLDYLQVLSPANSIHRALHEVAGSGIVRAARFQREVRMFFRHYFASIGEATMNQQRLSVTEAEAIGELRFAESPSWSTIVTAALGLTVLIVVVLLHCARTSRRLEHPVG